MTAKTPASYDYFCLLCRRWTWQATCPKCSRPTRYDAPPVAQNLTLAEAETVLVKAIFGDVPTPEAR